VKRRSTPGSPRPARASGDRWLFGYADIVTLLFACFAAMYAAKAVPVTAAPAARDIRLTLDEHLDAPTLDLARQLQSIARDAGTTSLDVARSARGLVLSLEEAGSFPAGSADLTPDAERVMLLVAGALRRLPNAVRVEGHTDDTPIRTPLFASNWELSTARATRVVELFAREGGLEPSRLSAAGYAQYRPRVANDSLTARARNRRVDVVILDAAAGSREEARTQP
jgi:chemotaxis protein MotB